MSYWKTGESRRRGSLEYYENKRREKGKGKLLLRKGRWQRGPWGKVGKMEGERGWWTWVATVSSRGPAGEEAERRLAQSGSSQT